MSADQAALFPPSAAPGLRPWQGGLSDPAAETVGLHHAEPRDTERAAAELVAPRTGTARLRVLTIIAESIDPLTDYDISRLTGVRLYTAAPRRYELLHGGWIEDSGVRRPTDSGANAIAWRMTERGRAEWNRREVGC